HYTEIVDVKSGCLFNFISFICSSVIGTESGDRHGEIAAAVENAQFTISNAGRRAAGTLLTQLTGNAVAAQYVLRHSDLAMSTAFYAKPSREEAVTGLRL